MSNNVKGFVVTLKEPVNEEYAEKIKNAILMVGNVLSVESSEDFPIDMMNREMVRCVFKSKLLDFIREIN